MIGDLGRVDSLTLLDSAGLQDAAAPCGPARHRTISASVSAPDSIPMVGPAAASPSRLLLDRPAQTGRRCPFVAGRDDGDGPRARPGRAHGTRVRAAYRSEGVRPVLARRARRRAHRPRAMARGHTDSAPSSSTSTVPARSTTPSPRFRSRLATATSALSGRPNPGRRRASQAPSAFRLSSGRRSATALQAAGSARLPRSRRKPLELHRAADPAPSSGASGSSPRAARTGCPQCPGRPKEKPRTHAFEADDALRQRPISNANRRAGRGCRRACRAGRPSSMSGSPATRPRSAAAGRVRPDQRPRQGGLRARRQPARPHPSTDARGPSCSQAASAACCLILPSSSSHHPYAAMSWTDHPAHNLAATTDRDGAQSDPHHGPSALGLSRLDSAARAPSNDTLDRAHWPGCGLPIQRRRASRPAAARAGLVEALIAVVMKLEAIGRRETGSDAVGSSAAGLI